MTTTIEYTDKWLDLDSTVVWDVWYDSTKAKAFLSLEGEIYAYSSVSKSDVLALVDAPSLGGHLSQFKRAHGPSQKLGGDNTITKVSLLSSAGVAPSGYSAASGVVPKNLTYAPNTTLTNANYVNLYASEPVETADAGTFEPKTVPLRPVASANEPVELPKRTHTVHFESNGPKTYAVEATGVDAAVAELATVADALGVTLKVTGVFVHLA